MYFPGGSDDKESACNAGDPGSISASGRSLEKGMATHSSGTSLVAQRLKRLPGIQETRLRSLGQEDSLDPMDRGAWRATVHGVTKN